MFYNIIYFFCILCEGVFWRCVEGRFLYGDGGVNVGGCSFLFIYLCLFLFLCVTFVCVGVCRVCVDSFEYCLWVFGCVC